MLKIQQLINSLQIKATVSISAWFVRASFDADMNIDDKIDLTKQLFSVRNRDNEK